MNRLLFIISEIKKLINDKVRHLEEYKKSTCAWKKFSFKQFFSLPPVLIGGQPLYRYTKACLPKQGKNGYYIRYKNYIDYLLNY